MENKKPTTKKESNDKETKVEVTSVDSSQSENISKIDKDIIVKSNPVSPASKVEIPKKPVKPPKLEDKPFDEFISKHFIPSLRSSIEETGTLVNDIKLIEGKRPVVGGNCWMVFCEISKQRRFWLCFNREIITSDKTILLAESNSDPSIVESFLIDEKKTTLPLLISRVLQRLNGQKWIGAN